MYPPTGRTRDEPLKTWEAILPTVSLINVLQYNSGELCSTATDPRATVSGPQTENDPHCRPHMIPRGKSENGQDLSYWFIVLRLLSQKNVLIQLNYFNK